LHHGTSGDRRKGRSVGADESVFEPKTVRFETKAWLKKSRAWV